MEAQRVKLKRVASMQAQSNPQRRTTYIFLWGLANITMVPNQGTMGMKKIEGYLCE
jgi:hypothetical protein